MSPKTGRPIEGQARKDIKLQIRVDRPTLDSIDELAKKLGITRTGVMMKGIELVRNSLDK
jgi:hypothetical protein